MPGAATASGGTGGGTSATCVPTLALINNALSTPAVTASGNVAFYFSAPYSPFPGSTAGFQCRLAASASGSTAGGQLHDWRACSSPDSYNGLPDGYYTFQVWERRKCGADQGEQLVIHKATE